MKTSLLAAGMLLAVSAPALACTQITSATVKLTGCVADEWQQVEGTGAQEFVYNTADGNFGLMVITEKEVFTMAQFRDAIVANAVNGNGGDPAKVQIVSERIETISGEPWSVVEYAVDYQGSPLTFQNYYLSKPGYGSVQILGYSLTTMATSAAWKAGVFAGSVSTN
ncbi:MAG: hypothetical protein ABL879_16500 [Devosia sp.]